MTQYSDRIIDAYNELNEEAIPDFMKMAKECKVGRCDLYYSAMPEEKSVIAHVGVRQIDKSEVWSQLRSALKPHYRTDEHPFTPRLNGQLQLHGEYQTKAMEAALRINQLKKDFGNFLKEDHPQMHKRTAYLRNHFPSLSAKSVHRQLIIGDQTVQKTSMHWSENNPKAVFVKYDGIRSILSYKCEPDYVDTLMEMVNKRMSSDPAMRFVHILDVRVHPVQYVKVAKGSGYDRKPYRSGLPLLVLGEQPLPHCEFGDYTFGMVRKRQNNKPKHTYFEILPEFGLYQRKLTATELKNAEEW